MRTEEAMAAVAAGSVVSTTDMLKGVTQAPNGRGGASTTTGTRRERTVSLG